jgi:histidine triad (HIT) family protein
MPALPHDPNCVFCKICNGQIPSHKVFEDEAVFAFLDIGPLTRGHCLLIPKAHYRNVLEIPPDLIAQVSSRLPKLAQAVLAATGAKACHILLNNGPEALQSVDHLHYHIIPRQAGDGFTIPWHAGKLDRDVGAELAGIVARHLVHS